jgi:hypothetical protein
MGCGPSGAYAPGPDEEEIYSFKSITTAQEQEAG